MTNDQAEKIAESLNRVADAILILGEKIASDSPEHGDPISWALGRGFEKIAEALAERGT